MDNRTESENPRRLLNRIPPLGLPAPSHRTLLAKLARSPLIWIAFSAICALLDYWSGPLVHFQIAYALPVSMAAWHRGLRWAVPMAIVLSGIRLTFLNIESMGVPWVLAGNLIIRMGALISLALLVNHTARLAFHVAHLEGLLSVCAWCKRIRNQDGDWVSLETYFTAQDKVVLTHGICPECSLRFGRGQ